MSTNSVPTCAWLIASGLIALLPTLGSAQFNPQFGGPSFPQQATPGQIHSVPQQWNLNPFDRNRGPRVLNYPNYGGIRTYDFYNFGAPMVSQPTWFGAVRPPNMQYPQSNPQFDSDQYLGKQFLDFNQPQNLPMPHRPFNANPNANRNPIPVPQQRGIPPELDLLR